MGDEIAGWCVPYILCNIRQTTSLKLECSGVMQQDNSPKCISRSSSKLVEKTEVSTWSKSSLIEMLWYDFK